MMTRETRPTPRGSVGVESFIALLVSLAITVRHPVCGLSASVSTDPPQRTVGGVSSASGSDGHLHINSPPA